MNDFSLGYVLDGRHFGTGIGIGKPPEAFSVRDHVEHGGYVETLYVPERTCENTSMKSDQWLCSECGGNYDIANINLDPDEDSGIPNYCPNCGAKVVSK